MLTQGYAGLPLMCVQVSDGIVHVFPAARSVRDPAWIVLSSFNTCRVVFSHFVGLSDHFYNSFFKKRKLLFNVFIAHKSAHCSEKQTNWSNC